MKPILCYGDVLIWCYNTANGFYKEYENRWQPDFLTIPGHGLRNLSTILASDILLDDMTAKTAGLSVFTKNCWNSIHDYSVAHV